MLDVDWPAGAVIAARGWSSCAGRGFSRVRGLISWNLMGPSQLDGDERGFDESRLEISRLLTVEAEYECGGLHLEF